MWVTTLSFRRIRGDMIEVYKIVTGKYVEKYRRETWGLHCCNQKVIPSAEEGPTDFIAWTFWLRTCWLRTFWASSITWVKSANIGGTVTDRPIVAMGET